MSRITQQLAAIAPAVERVIGNDEVTGSNPVGGTILNKILNQISLKEPNSFFSIAFIMSALISSNAASVNVS